MGQSGRDAKEVFAAELLKEEPRAEKTLFGGVLNDRPPVFAALALIFGIVLSAAVYQNNTAILVIFIVLLLFLIVAGVLTYLGRRLWLWVAFFFICGFTLYFIQYASSYVTPGVFEGSVLTGRVSAVTETDGKIAKYTYLIKDARLDGADTGANAYLYTDEPFVVGARISAEGKLTTFNYDPFDSLSMSYYNDNVKHRMVSENARAVDFESLRFFEKIREDVKRRYLAFLGEDAAPVALSLVLGDRSLLPDDVNDAFKIAGLSHLFSVSGLHIGFIAALVFFACQKLRIGRRYALLVCLVSMLLYGAVSGFPASVIRAIVMTATGFLGFALFRRTDPLNALSLSAILILLFRPMSLFELGFQMSYAAILGIICFYSPLRKRLVKGKNPFARFVGNSIAMSLSSNAFLFIIAVNTFSGFGLYFCLSNLLVIPVIGVLYALTMAGTLLSLISWYAGVLLMPLSYPYIAISYVTQFVAGLPGAYPSVSGLGVLTLLYCAALLFMSRFFMVKMKTKYRALIVFVCISLVIGFVFLRQPAGSSSIALFPGA